MTHYYLNLINGLGLTRDHEGEDFADVDAARARAEESVRSLLCDELKSAGKIDLHGRIEVVDQHGSIVLILPFRDAIDLRLDDSPAAAEGT
jgi:hypothetical protein